MLSFQSLISKIILRLLNNSETVRSFIYLGDLWGPLILCLVLSLYLVSYVQHCKFRRLNSREKLRNPFFNYVGRILCRHYQHKTFRGAYFILSMCMRVGILRFSHRTSSSDHLFSENIDHQLSYTQNMYRWSFDSLVYSK